jgi:hypothetical protein
MGSARRVGEGVVVRYSALQWERRRRMAQRTNRVAWGLAVMLAIAMLAEIGLLFTHGLTLGNLTVEVHLRPVVRPAFGPGGSEEGPFGGEGRWGITRSYNCRLFVVEVCRNYYQEYPPQP